MEPEGSSTARTADAASSAGASAESPLPDRATPQPSVTALSAAASDGPGESPTSDVASGVPIEAGWDRSPTVVRPLVQDGTPETTLEMAQRLVGMQLGDYLLEAPVGGGGMGIVFRARDLRLERVVAVKLLTNRWERDGELKRRFQNEAQSAARLNHENIATIFDVGESNGWNYIVFEFLEGINVRDLVERDGPLPIDTAIHVTRQITHALAHAATRDVVHRDIKPSNILLTPENRAKLVDMGLARLHDVRPTSGDLTASGVTLGTFDYISPEQAEDPRRADLRSDIYSLGCTLYFMLTGRPPFPDGTVLQKLLSHTKEDAPDPRLVRPDIPIGLLHVLKRMMAKAPTDRYQHPEVLIADLAAIQQGRLPYPSAAANRPVPPTPLRNLIPWLAPALILMVSLLSAEIYVSVSTYEPKNIPEFEAPHRSESTPKTPPKREAITPNELLRDPPAASPQKPSGAENPPQKSRGAPTASSPNSPPPQTVNVAPSPNTLPQSPSNLGQNPRKVVRVLVAKTIYTVPDAYVTMTLDEAFQYCSVHREIESIDLEMDGSVSVNTPIRFSTENLTISAVAGYRPTIDFSSRESTLETHQIELASGRLTWKDLHLVWNVPPTLREPTAMFLLHEGTSCNFRHCTLTLRNDSQPAHYHNSLAWLTLATPVPTASKERPSSVEVEDSYVRGEGSLLEIQSGSRLKLTVRQSAILLTDVLFRFNAPQRGIPHRDGNKITLQNVLADCQAGIGVINTGFDGATTPTVDVKIAQSVVILPVDHSLFSHQGSAKMPDYLRSFQYQGNGNIYRGPGNFWDINARGDDHHDTLSWSQWKSHWQGIDSHGELESQYLPSALAFTKAYPLHFVPINALQELLPTRKELTNSQMLNVGAQLTKIHVASFGLPVESPHRMPEDVD